VRITTPAPETAVTASDEDVARAGNYALLARLYYAAPDTALLQAIARAAEAAGEATDGFRLTPLATAWLELGNAAQAAEAEAIGEEYDDVFIGTGKAEITLYASHYLRLVSPVSMLADLRGELAALGLGRTEKAAEPEDHLAALCDTMRHLILRQSSPQSAVVATQQQLQFFMAYISPWYAEFCIAVAASSHTNFYKHVATFSGAFFDVEAEAFNLS